MEVQHRYNEPKGAFYIEENGVQQAAMTYTMASKTMIINHTEVDDSLRGKGAGVQMLVALVQYVREKGLKVIPLCPFAKSVFQKREDLRDVLK